MEMSWEEIGDCYYVLYQWRHFWGFITVCRVINTTEKIKVNIETQKQEIIANLSEKSYILWCT